MGEHADDAVNAVADRGWSSRRQYRRPRPQEITWAELVPKCKGLVCPKCRGHAVVRQNRNTGTWFLGCSRFPSCRHTWPGSYTIVQKQPADEPKKPSTVSHDPYRTYRAMLSAFG